MYKLSHHSNISVWFSTYQPHHIKNHYQLWTGLLLYSDINTMNAKHQGILTTGSQNQKNNIDPLNDLYVIDRLRHQWDDALIQKWFSQLKKKTALQRDVERAHRKLTLLEVAMANWEHCLHMLIWHFIWILIRQMLTNNDISKTNCLMLAEMLNYGNTTSMHSNKTTQDSMQCSSSRPWTLCLHETTCPWQTVCLLVVGQHDATNLAATEKTTLQLFSNLSRKSNDKIPIKQIAPQMRT